MIEEANSEYEKMDALLNQYSNKIDEINRENEEKVSKSYL